MRKYLFTIIAILLAATSSAQNVGIGTTTPKARLHVSDSAVLFSGTPALPASPTAPPAEGEGIRFMWYPQKAALRTGYVEDVNWNQNNIGIYSTAAGYNTIAAGLAATALGSNSNASGNHSLAAGYSAAASGSYSAAMGGFTKAMGNGSL